MKKNSTLDRLLLNEDGPNTLSSNVKELLGTARSLGVPRPTAQTYLHCEPAFTLHHPQRYRFPRSKTVVGPSVDHTWQADLVQMQDPKLVRHDVLSKYAWVVVLKSKRGAAVRNALRHLLENESALRCPVKLQTDQGKESCNRHVKRLLDQYDIHDYSTQGEPKAVVSERLIARSKNSCMTAHNTLKYLDALPELLARYNQRIHSSIEMALADVNRHNDEEVWRRLFKSNIPSNP